jgi:oligopeptide/dipeptide ABC transporter ATP-binding protein
MGLILITHDMGVVAETAERVQVQYAGQKVEEQNVRDLFSDPHHPYTQALLSALPERATKHGRLPSIPGVVPGQGDRPNGLPVFGPRCRYATERCAQEAVRQGAEFGFALCNYPLKDGVPTGHPEKDGGGAMTDAVMERRTGTGEIVVEAENLKRITRSAAAFSAAGTVKALDGVSFRWKPARRWPSSANRAAGNRRWPASSP